MVKEMKNKKSILEESENWMNKIVTHILKKIANGTESKERCAASIWLLALVNYCGKNKIIQGHLGDIQSAFSLLLADGSQITQEVASKGLVILYEIGNEETKKRLVSDLVTTLQTGKTGFKKTMDSELFGENELGKKMILNNKLC